jgi:hypothetical protein
VNFFVSIGIVSLARPPLDECLNFVQWVDNRRAIRANPFLGTGTEPTPLRQSSGFDSKHSSYCGRLQIGRRAGCVRLPASKRFIEREECFFRDDRSLLDGVSSPLSCVLDRDG